ncbi:Hypothetical Protein FCC1311_080692 [Hondaea fermentalgiana]|uniref:Uncharacterized protein n=1 Tax=Hondaea fermentalgiana TaxID=2315210 RepID=A0A2R5GV99_9STRA|nr:Hypothetical Protein FCC1311_080692 [Hondaea fermentalgiana]|eukprot:GBG31844.1 Hypothetical Protein FCC1311_080692 [Hondaea fermentalgiana]
MSCLPLRAGRARRPSSRRRAKAEHDDDYEDEDDEDDYDAERDEDDETEPDTDTTGGSGARFRGLNGARRAGAGENGFALYLAYGPGQGLSEWVTRFDEEILSRYFGLCSLCGFASNPDGTSSPGARSSLARLVRASRSVPRAGDRRAVTALAVSTRTDDTDALLTNGETKIANDNTIVTMSDCCMYVAFANEQFAYELLGASGPDSAQGGADYDESQDAEGAETRAAFEAAPRDTRIIIELDHGLDPIRQYAPEMLEQMPLVLSMQSRDLKSVALSETLAVKLVLLAHDMGLPSELRARAFEDTVRAIQGVWQPAGLDKASLLRGLQVHADIINECGALDLFHRAGLYMIEENPGWLNELLDATMYPDTSTTSRALDINVLYTIHLYVCWDPLSKAMYERVSGLFSSNKERELNVSKRAVRVLEADDYRCARRMVALALRHKNNADAQIYVASSLERLARRAATKQLAAFAMPYALQTVEDMTGTPAGAKLITLMQILVSKKAATSADKARFRRHQASINLDAA